MEFTETLKKNHEFRRLYSKGNSAATPYLVIYARRGRRNRNRIGLTVSTKIGNAVTRNRVRRRLKELYRVHEGEFAPGMDIVIVARGRAVEAKHMQLERALLGACSRLGLLREAGGERE